MHAEQTEANVQGIIMWVDVQRKVTLIDFWLVNHVDGIKFNYVINIIFIRT